MSKIREYLDIEYKKMSPKRSPRERAWQKETVLKGLPKEEAAKLTKLYPFRVERDAAVCRLRARGVLFDLLSDITGLSLAQVKRIAKEGGLAKVRRKRGKQ